MCYHFGLPRLKTTECSAEVKSDADFFLDQTVDSLSQLVTAVSGI